MNIETLVTQIQQDVDALKRILHYVASHPEAFELLEHCNAQQAAGDHVIYCHPPKGVGAAFARLLGLTAWNRQPYNGGKYWDWIGKPDGESFSLHVFAAEAMSEAGEVRL
jgi:hypothetical protein